MPLAALYKRLGAVRTPIRSLVLLYWIYIFTWSLASVFTQLFLYDRFQSLPVNVLANMVFYTGCMIGFCVCGYFAGWVRIPIRQGFLWSIVIVALSFVLLLDTRTPTVAYFAMLLSGVGEGLFYLTLHALELAETKDEERDLYSSLLSVGDYIFGLLGPACATALLWLSSNIFHRGEFTLLFIIAPIVYALGFFCFAGLQDYRPTMIAWRDAVHFFKSGRNRALQLNVIGESFDNSITSAVVPLVLLIIAGSAVRVGLLNTFIGICSLICVLAIAHRRSVGNRLIILAYASAVMAGALLWLGYVFSFSGLLVYVVAASIAGPLMSVSNRAIALRSMESLNRSQSDFYASMIIRDFSLWAWRMILGGLFFLLVIHIGSGYAGLSSGLYLGAIGLIVTFLAARTIVLWK